MFKFLFGESRAVTTRRELEGKLEAAVKFTAAKLVAEHKAEIKKLRKEMAVLKAGRTRALNKSAKEYETRREAWRALKRQAGEHRSEVGRLEGERDAARHEAQRLQRQLNAIERDRQSTVPLLTVLFIFDAMVALGRGYSIWVRGHAGPQQTIRTHDEFIDLVRLIHHKAFEPRQWQELAGDPLDWNAVAPGENRATH